MHAKVCGQSERARKDTSIHAQACRMLAYRERWQCACACMSLTAKNTVLPTCDMVHQSCTIIAESFDMITNFYSLSTLVVVHMHTCILCCHHILSGSVEPPYETCHAAHARRHASRQIDKFARSVGIHVCTCEMTCPTTKCQRMHT